LFNRQCSILYEIRVSFYRERALFSLFFVIVSILHFGSLQVYLLVHFGQASIEVMYRRVCYVLVCSGDDSLFGLRIESFLQRFSTKDAKTRYVLVKKGLLG
jgi:hypothetical protein